jgi:hypothetical protein
MMPSAKPAFLILASSLLADIAVPDQISVRRRVTTGIELASGKSPALAAVSAALAGLHGIYALSGSLLVTVSLSWRLALMSLLVSKDA